MREDAKRPHDARRGQRLAIGAGFAAATAYVLWLLSARFSIPGPSAIDDWNGASRPTRGPGELLAPFFEAPVQRFRPGFDLYDHLQWHTFGAPLDMTGPNVWNALRVALLVAAIGAIPALVARSAWPRLSPAALGGLAFVAPAVVATGAATAVDLARLAPQEPLLIGATVCGAAMVLWALDRHLTGASRGATIALAVAGWPLFAVGATFKEASLAFLACAPFLYLFLAERWRDRGVAGSWLAPLRRPAVLVAAGMLALPLLWMGFRAATLGDAGADLYQAGAPSGIDGWRTRLESAWSVQWANLSGTVGSPLWRALAVALPLLALAVALDRRRMPWLALGLGAAAIATMVFQGLPAIVTSRYYLPTMALLAMAAVLLLAQGRAWLRWTALVAGLAIVLSNAGSAREAVEGWAAGESATSAFVQRVAELAGQGCEIHASGLDVERGEALPRLVGLELERPAEGRCPLGDAALVATIHGADPVSMGWTGLWGGCREEWQTHEQSGMWLLLGCERLRPRVDGVPTRSVLHAARLVPGVGALDRAACLEAGDGDGCDEWALDRSAMWR